MASTLGVLDVLSRLREESERAATALAAQEDTNRGLLQKCSEAERESGRTDVLAEALQAQKRELEEGWRLAETRKKEAEGRLLRLQSQKARRDEAAAQKRQSARTSADGIVESSKRFRADASARVRQIGELGSRLREKMRDLDRIRNQTHELNEELNAKKAARDKVKTELAARRKKVAAALAKAEEADRENATMLAKARCVEAEIDEVRQTQEELQEMATGLHKKNAIMRNELRHLKRAIEEDDTQTPSRSSVRGYKTHSPPSSSGRSSAARCATNERSSREYRRSGNGGPSCPDEREGAGHYYHHSAAPQDTIRTTELQLEASPSPYRQQQQQQYRRNNTTVGASFSTPTSATVMPELRLSSPHPSCRTTNVNTVNSLSSRGDDPDASSSRWNNGSGHRSADVDPDRTAAQSEHAFDYHA